MTAYQKTYFWRHDNPVWTECYAHGDIPTTAEIYNWEPVGPKTVGLNGKEYYVESSFPGYLYSPPVNSLVNFYFNPSNRTIALNWSFSYGIVQKSVEFKAVDKTRLPSGCPEFSEDSLYFIISDKGGLSVIAVQLCSPDE